MRRLLLALPVGIAALVYFGSQATPQPAAKRIPWTASHVRGTPEPPLPYVTERVFPKLTFREPVFMVHPPTSAGADRWFVGERFGRIWSFPKNPDVAKADLVVDFAKQLDSFDPSQTKGVSECYALAFHPQFAKNRYVYVCLIFDGNARRQQLPDGSRISRFKMTDTDPPRIDVKTEQIVLTWLGGGHNGCDMHFGNDGFLYISTGDGASPNPPDRYDFGQDMSSFNSKILRIDVDKSGSGKNYGIPADNPFVKMPGARPEVYAYGFRNPWRMSFDRPTGDLWVGDVGWELWEMVDRVQKGGNYGWSIKEGPQDVRPNGKRGPTPILPPTLDFPHTEAASITGGYVYRGKRLPDLIGAYLCGDWVTRKLWATKFDGDRIVWHKEIAQGNERVVAFSQDTDGELFFLHHDDRGSIHRLVPNPEAKDYKDVFPRKLSDTGLFASVVDHKLAAGVFPFQVAAARWVDGATTDRFVAIPGAGTAELYDEFRRLEADFFGSFLFPPAGTVLGETFMLETKHGDPGTRRRLETQILHFDGKHWRGYSYRWNDTGTDADLVGARGADLKIDVADPTLPGGKHRQTWHLPSRTECMICHNPWSGYALAFTPLQLQRDIDIGGTKASQIDHLRSLGLIDLKHADRDGKVSLPTPLANPYDRDAPLDARARSYLHVNCSHCHQFGAGGSVDIEFRYTESLDHTKAVDVPPVQGTFGIDGAKIIAPGDPYRSTLYYRMAKMGRGRMPHIGSEIIDEPGVRLMHDWIRSLPADAEAWKLFLKLQPLDEAAALAREKRNASEDIRQRSRQIAEAHGRDRATAHDYRRAFDEYAESCARGAKERPIARAEIYAKLLSAPNHALAAVREVALDKVPSGSRGELIAAAMKHPDASIRDLFERFVPDSQRVERLGTQVVPEKLLAMPGDIDRGRAIFFQPTFQCGTCHTIAGKGGQIGPDLTVVASRLTPGLILESILEPSKVIDPKYQTYVAETTSGKLYTGLLIEKSNAIVVLRPATGKDVRLDAKDIVGLQAQRTSLMPEQLLRDVTPQQAADLLTYLRSLKGPGSGQ
ncbi:MAG TPA: PQQ-dependent sugar dehydrogenase [Gemmataceae bacterium]|jgi:putative heme-binding domain-containing protein|nr:PQQ-dependent sugar dehydrogenase [Gemmataceae bacterium]